MFYSSILSILATCMYYTNVPVKNMTEEPNQDSKVVSQTFYSEQVSVEKASGNWSYITTSDKYQGWIETNCLIELNDSYPKDQNFLTVTRSAAHIYSLNDTEYGPLKTVPFGTKFQLLDNSDARWVKVILPDGNTAYIQKGDVVSKKELLSKGELVEFSKQFLGLPYTWGGRSSFGYDCSGYVQMLYSQIGISLQRDSKLQILDPRLKTIPLEDLEPGDLVFFGYDKARIRHVVMHIGNGEFIHTSVRENKPYLRISKLTDFEWSGDPNAFYPYREAKQLVVP